MPSPANCGLAVFDASFEGLPQRPRHEHNKLAPGDRTAIERFNGKLREECLNLNLFKTLEETKEKIESWRVDYNVHRPHSALNDQTPSELAENFD